MALTVGALWPLSVSDNAQYLLQCAGVRFEGTVLLRLNSGVTAGNSKPAFSLSSCELKPLDPGPRIILNPCFKSYLTESGPGCRLGRR